MRPATHASTLENSRKQRLTHPKVGFLGPASKQRSHSGLSVIGCWHRRPLQSLTSSVRLFQWSPLPSTVATIPHVMQGAGAALLLLAACGLALSSSSAAAGQVESPPSADTPPQLPPDVLFQLLYAEPNNFLQSLGNVRAQGRRRAKWEGCCRVVAVVVPKRGRARWPTPHVLPPPPGLQISDTEGSLTRTFLSPAHRRAAGKVQRQGRRVGGADVSPCACCCLSPLRPAALN